MGSASDKRRAREAAARRVRKRLGAPGVKRAAKAKITTNVKSGGGGGGRSKTVTQPVVTAAEPAKTSAAKPQVTQASREKALEPFTKTPFQQIQERQITYAASIGREEIPTRYPQGVTEKPKSRFQRAEELVARRVTQPIARAAAARGVTKERVAKAVTAVTVKQFEKSPFL
ncbi:MAG: hypothetical protein CL526_01870, partial [Aequorivita sp.]|nr:hypothetical protein [Aequorivita sp.]